MNDTSAHDKHSTWDAATACQRLVDEGLTPAEIAERTGQTRKHVQNHLRCLRELEPSILRAWQEGHPAAVVDFLRELAGLPHDQQLTRWSARLAGGFAGKRPTKRAIERALEMIDKSGESADWRRGAADALAFVLGRAGGLGPYRRIPRL